MVAKAAAAAFAAALAAVPFAGARAGPPPAHSAPDVIDRDVVPLPALGYAGDVVRDGAHPHLELVIPFHARLQLVRLRLAIRPSPAVDPRSLVVVRLDGVVARRLRVNDLRRDETVALDVTPSGRKRRLRVTVDGALFATGDRCADARRRSLWLALRRTSRIELVQLQGARPFVADFLDPYAGRVRVVAGRGASTETLAAAVPLAYWLHQIERWRDRDVSLAEQVDPAAQNIVLDQSAASDMVAGRTLTLGVRKFAETRRTLEALATTPATRADERDLALKPLFPALGTFQDIGSTTAFAAVEAVHGRTIANGADVRVDVRHDLIPAHGAATIAVAVNGNRAETFRLHRASGNESLVFPIDARALRAENVLALTTAYDANEPRACGATAYVPSIEVAPSSTLHWRDRRPLSLAIGDVLAATHGKVVVITPDPSLLRYLFAVVDVLGRTDHQVSRVDVRYDDWHVPGGYDAAILVLPPELLRETAARFRHNDVFGTLAGVASGDVRERVARLHDYVSLQSALIRGTPTLIVSYTGAPSAIGALGRLSTDTFLEQRGDLLIADATGVVFAKTDAPAIPEESYAEHVRKAALPVLFGFVLLVGAVVSIAANRAEPLA